jgi:hypothetical protein
MKKLINNNMLQAYFKNQKLTNQKKKLNSSCSDKDQLLKNKQI